MTGFVAFSGLIGFVFAPRNEGKTLEQIQLERHGRPRVPRSAPVPADFARPGVVTTPLMPARLRCAHRGESARRVA